MLTIIQICPQQPSNNVSNPMQSSDLPDESSFSQQGAIHKINK